MPHNNRSQRQISSLKRVREWHLNSAISALMAGRKQEAGFHFRNYDLLGHAVDHSENWRGG